jgi:hypothetical protein
MTKILQATLLLIILITPTWADPCGNSFRPLCVVTTVVAVTPTGNGDNQITLDINIFVDNPGSGQEVKWTYASFDPTYAPIQMDIVKNNAWNKPILSRELVRMPTQGLEVPENEILRFHQFRGRYPRSMIERVTVTARDGDELYIDIQAPHAYRAALGAGDITLTLGENIIPNICRFNTADIYHDHGDHLMTGGGGGATSEPGILASNANNRHPSLLNQSAGTGSMRTSRA